MIDNQTTEQRKIVNRLLFDLESLEIMFESPLSDMTMREYEQEREKLLDEFFQDVAATLGSEHEAKLIQAMEDVLRHSTDTVWVGEAETLVDRMVSIDVYNQDVYEGTRPWEVD